MADIKWIKLKVGMFDGESFKKIKRAKIGGESFRDKLTAVWFELLDLAGKGNCGGALANEKELAYSELEDIAVMLDREKQELDLCIAFFLKEQMIEIIDNVYFITNWSKYQNVEKLEIIREQTKNRVAKYREKQKMLNCNAKSVTQALHNANVTHLDIELESIKKVRKGGGGSSFDEIISTYTNDAELKTNIFEFIKMRQLIKKPMTNRALEMLLNKLDRIASDNAVKIEVLSNSIINSWQNIYAPKDQQDRQEPPQLKYANGEDF